jgi:hypothetical protein
MTVRFGEVSVLFEPFDDVASSRRPSDTEAASGRLPAEEPAADGSAVRPRRPIRVTPPRPSGPPAWLIALLVIAAAVAAFLLLR